MNLYIHDQDVERKGREEGRKEQKETLWKK